MARGVRVVVRGNFYEGPDKRNANRGRGEENPALPAAHLAGETPWGNSRRDYGLGRKTPGMRLRRKSLNSAMKPAWRNAQAHLCGFGFLSHTFSDDAQPGDVLEGKHVSVKQEGANGLAISRSSRRRAQIPSTKRSNSWSLSHKLAPLPRMSSSLVGFTPCSAASASIDLDSEKPVAGLPPVPPVVKRLEADFRLLGRPTLDRRFMVAFATVSPSSATHRLLASSSNLPLPPERRVNDTAVSPSRRRTAEARRPCTVFRAA